MQTLDALQRRERAIAAVRAAAGVFAIAQALLYEPVTGELAEAAATLAIACGAAFITVSGVAEVMLRVAATPADLHRAGLWLLVLDVGVALGLVAAFAFDPASATWALLTVLPLIGAVRRQLLGALATWAAIAVGYAVIELTGPQPTLLSLLLFRIGLLLVIATFAGVALQQLERQREVLSRLHSASRELAGRLDPGEVLGQTCREAVRCADAASAVVYTADDGALRPVAAWPPHLLDKAAAISPAGRDDAGDVGGWRRGWWRRDPANPANYLVVPLGRGDTEHVLEVRPRSRRGFGPLREQAVLAVADSASVALAASGVVAAQQRAAHRLEQLEALRTRFVAAVAHDLRRPLTVIGGLASLLAKGPDAVPRDRLDALVADVQRQANRLNRLADDLLDAARAQDEQLRLRSEPTSVARVVRTAAADVDGPVEIDVDDALVVPADDARLERVLWNLLSNAEKYGQPPFEVRARNDGDWVRLEVRDHGRGLDADQQARLADEFTAGEDPASVGLGLAIVWRLVGAHGGEVRYHDAGPGARFEVRLPAEADPGGPADAGQP